MDKKRSAPISVRIPEPEQPKSHLLQRLQREQHAEDKAWEWFVNDEIRRNPGVPRKKVNRWLRKQSFIAGYRAGNRAGLAAQR